MNRPLRLLPVLLCLAMLTGLTGCFGVLARQNVLAPAVASAWTGVKDDITRGPAAVPDGLADFDAAIVAKDRVKLAPLVASTWPTLRSTAYLNINAASWSDGVKAIEKDRLQQFDAALLKAVEK